MASTTRPPGDDRGAILIMAMLLVGILAIVAATIAGYGAASFRFTRVVRTLTQLRTSADAGLRITIDQLARHQTMCADLGGSDAPVPGASSSATVRVACAPIAGTLPGVNHWAMILTGIGANATYLALRNSPPASAGGTQRIGGAVYLANPASTDVSNLRLEDGDLWYPATDCATATPPTISGLTIAPSPPRGRLCTPKSWDDLVPDILLPDIPVTEDPAGHDEFVNGCRVFLPGRYTAPPVLAAENYFVSGDYYFEFDGAFEIKQAVVIGGRIDPTLGDVQYLPAPSCDGVADDPDVQPFETNGYGTTWFMGGGASISITANGKLELFRRRQGTQAVSLMAVPQTAGGYAASTVTMPAGRPLLDLKEGAGQEAVIHGSINAPRAQVKLGNVTSSAAAQALGGIVAAGIDMGSSASATGFVIAVSSPPVQAKLQITSTATAADGTSVAVRAIVDYEPSRTVAGASISPGSTTLTAPSGGFGPGDVGSAVTGRGILPLTRIASVSTPTSVTLTQAATGGGSNVSVVVHTARVAVNSWRRL